MNKSLHKKSKSYDIFSIRESKSASFPIFPLGSYSDYPYLNPIDTGAVVRRGGGSPIFPSYFDYPIDAGGGVT